MRKNKTVFEKINKLQVILTLFLWGGILVSYGQNGCPQVPKSILDGANGFSIEGKTNNDDLGYTTKSAGDINHDGIPDIMIGAPGVDFGGLEDVGEIYIIFGGSGFSFETFDISTLNGTNGFVIRGAVAHEKLGATLNPAGDFNNDGIDDIIVGENYDETGMGGAFVFFGANSFQALYSRTSIDNTKGLFITCDTAVTTYVRDVSYAGDINHDGISDVIITEYYQGFAQYYIVFGSSAITSLNTSSLNGTNGFNISGYSLSWAITGSIGRNAGDINHDGIDDLILGSPSFHDGISSNLGRVTIVFGKSSGFPAVFKLDNLTSAEGSIITNSVLQAQLGKSISAAGDFNNDGIDDIIVGAPHKEVNGIYSAGEAYVIFGSNSFPATLSVENLNTNTGVIFQGTKYNEQLGFSVAGLKDINHDGKADIAISSKEGISNNGALFVVFGGTTAKGIVKEATILNKVGYQIFDDFVGHTSKIFAYDAAGIGDFNNDGTNDFIFGSIRQEYYWDKGSAYIFYGEKTDRVDAVAPTIECPPNQELYANSLLPNYVSYLPNVIDNCTYVNTFDLVFTQTPPQGTLFTADTNVTISVTDVSGNKSSCTFLVKLKTPPPAITCKTTLTSLNDLNGANGFTIYGETGAIETGFDVNKAGDINDDGIADFIVSAVGRSISFSGTFGNRNDIIKGSVYVIYGKSSGFPPIVYLGNLNGSNGFIVRDDLDPATDNRTGYKVAPAGDMNGDGVDDFMLSAIQKKQVNYLEGAVYVIFGKKGGLGSKILLSSLNGTNGFAFSGTVYYENVGTSIDSIGDFNHDGFDDIAIAGSGEVERAYIIYGKNGSFPALLLATDLNGTNGAVIKSNPAVDKIGKTIAGLGDVNGDGIPDIVVATYEGDKRYVIYGRSGFPNEFNVTGLNGSNGFVVENSTETLRYTDVNKIGDVNHDGLNDIVFNKRHILFGSANIPAAVDLKNLNGTNGFAILNASSDTRFGGVGDFNKDGIDDYVFIASGSEAYVLYGKSTWISPVNLYHLNPKEAQVFGFNYAYYTPISFAGDINNDGFDDIVIGNSQFSSPFLPYKINQDPGKSYVIFGRAIVLDTEKPVILNCQGNKILPVGSEIPDYKSETFVQDNCDYDPVITQSPLPGTIFTGGTQTITLTVTDASTNYQTCVFTISDGIDKQPPVLTCPGNQQLACGDLVPDYIPLLTVTDDMDTNVELTQNPSAGTAFFDGMKINFTAKDDAGHESTCSIIINASGADTKPPTFTCPTNVKLYCGDLIPNYALDPMMNLADNCSDKISSEMTPPAGTPFYDGISIHIKYTDESGNSDECNFVIHLASPDFDDPVMNCIGNQTLACGEKIPDYTTLFTATDNCTASPVITQNPVAGSAFTDGMTVTVTATDAATNYTNCSFTVNVPADVTPPAITCIGDQNLMAGTPLPDYSSMVTALDNCDKNLTITQTPGPGSFITDGMNVVMSTSDNSGNEVNCSFIIHVVTDTHGPVFTCLGDQLLSCATTVIPDYTQLIAATDDFDPNPIVKQIPAAGTAFQEGMTVKIEVSDHNNNVTSCSFKLNSNPVIVDAGDDEQIDEGQTVQLDAITPETGTYQWNPSEGLSKSTIANPVASPTETTTYTVIFRNEEGCETQDSVTITVIPVDKDDTKYGFSPNNDGINDVWEIDDITQYPTNKVSIYNRWGDLVFQTQGYNNTTNVFTGVANKSKALGANVLPEGTYFFEISVDQPHHFKKLKGYLVLKR